MYEYKILFSTKIAVVTIRLKKYLVNKTVFYPNEG